MGIGNWRQVEQFHLVFKNFTDVTSLHMFRSFWLQSDLDIEMHCESLNVNLGLLFPYYLPMYSK